MSTFHGYIYWILEGMTLNISKSINNNTTKRNKRRIIFEYIETTIWKMMHIEPLDYTR